MTLRHGLVVTHAWCALALAGPTSAQESAEDVYRTVAELDELVFTAFNERDLDRFLAFFSEDLEFYHDRDGFSGHAAMIENSLRVFFISGVYSILALTPMYFMEDRISLNFPPPIAHPEHFYGFVGVALAWQVLFLVLAHDPVRYRLMMLPAILEKLSFVMAAGVLFLQGRLAGAMLGPASIDLLLAGFFGLAFLRTGAVPLETD